MRTFTVSSSDITRCPISSLSPGHYTADGSCREHPGDRAVCRHCGQPITFRVAASAGRSRWEHDRTHRPTCDRPSPGRWPNRFGPWRVE